MLLRFLPSSNVSSPHPYCHNIPKLFFHHLITSLQISFTTSSYSHHLLLQQRKSRLSNLLSCYEFDSHRVKFSARLPIILRGFLWFCSFRPAKLQDRIVQLVHNNFSSHTFRLIFTIILSLDSCNFNKGNCR